MEERKFTLEMDAEEINFGLTGTNRGRDRDRDSDRVCDDCIIRHKNNPIDIEEEIELVF